MARTRYQDVASQLETLILKGEWKPGSRLPPLDDLATRFAVSRAVIREACTYLVGAGLLELRHGDGTYVKSFSLDTFLRPMHAALLLGTADIRVLLDVEMWLEKGVIGQVARRRTEADQDMLSQAMFVLEVAVGDVASVADAEQAFHLLLADLCKNDMAANLLRIVYHPLSAILRKLCESADTQQMVVAMHRSMYDSILRMDSDSAERHMELYRRALAQAARQLGPS